MMRKSILTFGAVAAAALTAGCQQPADTSANAANAQQAAGKRPASDYLSQPLVKDIFTADPSAHVWNGKIYVYPSHDIDGPTPEDDLGSHFEMRDYRVLRMDRIGGPGELRRPLDRFTTFLWLKCDGAHTVAGLVAALEAEFGEEAAPAAERVQKWLQRMLELGLLRLESGK